MRKAGYILIIILFIKVSVYAKKYPGYIIDKKGNKKEVIFKCRYLLMEGSPDYTFIQKSIKYLDGKQTVKLYPSECSKIGLITPHETVEFKSLPNRFINLSLHTDTHIFLRLKSEGPITVYYYYYWFSIYTGQNSTSKFMKGYILDNKNGESAVIGSGGRKKDFIALFSDYPELSRRIENKETKKWEIDRYIFEYNNWKEEQSLKLMKQDDRSKENSITEDRIQASDTAKSDTTFNNILK